MITKARVDTHRAHQIHGLNLIGQAYFCQETCRDGLLILTENDQAQMQVYSALKAMANAYLFPALDTLFLEPARPDALIMAQRCLAARTLKQGKGIVVASIDAILTDYPAQNLALELELKVDHDYDRSALTTKLKLLGYRHALMVAEYGYYSSRGRILDISYDAKIGYRLEFFGNTLLEIRQFSLSDQRSTSDTTNGEALGSIIILPADELSSVYHEKYRGSEGETSELEELIGDVNPLTYYYPQNGESILKMARSIAVCEVDLCRTILTTSYNHRTEKTKQIQSENGAELPELSSQRSLEFYQEILSTANLQFSHLQSANKAAIALEPQGEILSFNSDNLPQLKNASLAQNAGTLVKVLERLTGYCIVFVVGTREKGEAIREILHNSNYLDEIFYASRRNFSQFNCSYILGHIHESSVIHNLKIAFISEKAVFGRSSVPHSPRKSNNRLLNALNDGDYLVHIDFGIGRYRGLKQLPNLGGEFLALEYQDSTLYLPIYNLAKIHKYQSKYSDDLIEIDKLSSKKWEKTKEKVKKSVADAAAELLKLYSQREVAESIPYDAINDLDLELAKSFEYEETPDQAHAIEKTLADLTSSKPTDRLIVGDVGFGKTEVAIRAAFKVTQERRQVAFLAPTTILAEQHYQKFLERLAPFGVRIASLSRLISRKDISATLAKLHLGELDMIVGTHRLLSDDVRFHDLGLLIIDEEHRFGVRHKEKLKKYRNNLDILSLSATPIPRTLNQALLGIREISVISTPPLGRKAVKTSVIKNDPHFIREIILRELDRGGQVFYLHNRVKTIDYIADELRELIPEAKICVGHGQLDPKELDARMTAFALREYGILVSTTIIESGIDLPNVNTIIIANATSLGLAQLYQLRGRVGRSDRQGYCYFMIDKKDSPNVKVLTDIQDRLGIGYELAMRDLEIRGTGNLLGNEQAGNIKWLGYDLYMKLLETSIKGLKEPDFFEPEIKLNIPAFIPEDYIPDIGERLLVYQDINSIDESNLHAKVAELADLYGSLPDETHNLIDLILLKNVLKDYRIKLIEGASGKVTVYPADDCSLNPQKILRASQNKELTLLKGFAFKIELTFTKITEVRDALEQRLRALM